MCLERGMFMEMRIEMIKAGFRIRYEKRASFVEGNKNDELIKILIKNDNIENILRLCIAGQQPLLAVIDEIEEYAKNNMDEITKEYDFDTWKQNVGMLIGTIAYFIGYVRDEEKTLQNKPDYFMNASKFRKEL